VKSAYIFFYNKPFISMITGLGMGEENLCEQCYDHSAELDCFVDGEYKKICRQCSFLDKAVVFEKPPKVDIEGIKRATVRETLMRMSGLSRPHINKKTASLEDLRKVKKILDRESNDFADHLSGLSKPKADSGSGSKAWSSWASRRRQEMAKEDNQKKPEARLGDLKSDDEIINI
jgi:hypothetical protein